MAADADRVQKPALERGTGLHVDLACHVDDGRVAVRGHVEDRELAALSHVAKRVVPFLPAPKTQFCDGSSGMRASRAYCPPLRSSTLPQRDSGSSEKTSDGCAGATIQSSRP